MKSGFVGIKRLCHEISGSVFLVGMGSIDMDNHQLFQLLCSQLEVLRCVTRQYPIQFPLGWVQNGKDVCFFRIVLD